MKMTFEKMLDNMIRKFGFEHEAVIAFAGLENDPEAEWFYNKFMEMDIFEED